MHVWPYFPIVSLYLLFCLKSRFKTFDIRLLISIQVSLKTQLLLRESFDFPPSAAWYLCVFYRQYISYRLLLSLKMFTFWTRGDTLLVPAIRAENESATKCWSDTRITSHRTFNIKGQTSNQPRSSVLLSETELLLRNPLTLNRTYTLTQPSHTSA